MDTGKEYNIGWFSGHFFSYIFLKLYEPRSEKTGLCGFRPGPTQTGLYSHRR